MRAAICILSAVMLVCSGTWLGVEILEVTVGDGNSARLAVAMTLATIALALVMWLGDADDTRTG